MKKYISIFLMTIAYAILLGHDIVPHHHHEINNDLIGHHHFTSHHVDNDKDNEDCNNVFSHFVHSSEGITMLITQNINNAFSKQLFSLVALLPDNFLISNFIIAFKLQKPFTEQLFCLSPHSISSGLRAPPAC